MCSMTSIILCFTFFNVLVLVQCAPKLSAGDNYGIVGTEWAIRDTLNNLFSTLKLKVMQQNLKLKQYSTIHNFFVSITLRDHDNLKKITKLTQIDNIDNGTQIFITKLNEVLEEDNKSDVATDSVYVKILIKEFIDQLDHLKERNELQNNTKFDLNKAILRYFSNHENEFGNTTYVKKDLKRNDSDDNVLDSIESWQPSGRRIFDGTKSNIKRFPFMASVQFFKKFQCGGSIIKSDLIITSGSCLQIAYNNRFFRENPAFLSIQVGSSLYEQGGENVPVLEVNFHPNYNPKNLRHNLAIMRLTRMLKFFRKGKKIKKIIFDRNPWTMPSNTDGVVIVGWGARALGTNIINLWKNELSFSTLDFYPLAECQEIYTKEFVTDQNFCAGFFSKGGGACNHDAGGPGVSNGILVGVISFGAPVCGTPDAPTVFTKLGYYTDWIEEIMETKPLQGSQPTTQRTVSYHKFGLPSFKKTTPFRVTPIILNNPSKPFDRLRTNDEKHEFKDFLKTMFKKKKQKKQEQEEQQENVQEQEDERQQEDEREPEDLQEQEDDRKQESGQQQKDVEEQEDGQEQDDEQEQEVEQEQDEETEEVTDSVSRNKTQDLKELDKVKPKQLLRNKSETEPKKKKERKPSIRKPKSKLKRKEKTKMTTGSQSQSKENSDDKTTLRPNIAFEINKAKVTSLMGYYDASASTTPSFNKRNDVNDKTRSSQEKDIDDAIDSLIDDLSLNYIFKSKNSPSRDQQQMRARDDLHKDTVLNKSDLKTEATNTEGDANEEAQSDADDRSDKGNGNEKDDSSEDLSEDQASLNDETKHEQNVNNNKKVEISTTSRSAYNVEDDSNDKSENSEEVIHTKNEEQENDDTDDDYDDGGETDEEIKGFSIPAEVQDQDHSSNSTERLLEMIEYEDLYKLLMKDF